MIKLIQKLFIFLCLAIAVGLFVARPAQATIHENGSDFDPDWITTGPNSDKIKVTADPANETKIGNSVTITVDIPKTPEHAYKIWLDIISLMGWEKMPEGENFKTGVYEKTTNSEIHEHFTYQWQATTDKYIPGDYQISVGISTKSEALAEKQKAAGAAHPEGYGPVYVSDTLTYYILDANGQKVVAEKLIVPRGVGTETEFGNTDFGGYVSKILTWLVTIVSSLAVLMFIYAGYIYVTSQGSPEGVTQAKDIIIGVITGIILLFLIEVILVKTVGIKWQYL